MPSWIGMCSATRIIFSSRKALEGHVKRIPSDLLIQSQAAFRNDDTFALRGWKIGGAGDLQQSRLAVRGSFFRLELPIALCRQIDEQSLCRW